MTWQKWILVALFLLFAAVNVAMVGKPRKPTTPGVAAVSLLLWVGMVALVITA